MKEKLLGSILILLISFSGIWFVLWTTDNTGEKFVITTAECPSLAPVIEEKIIGFGDWKCEGASNDGEYDSDLLQPSGLWIQKTLDCWKLKMTVEEYCDKYPCSRNNGKPPHPAN